MTCDIFIKTYPRDAEWLVYCLRSIQKFVTGFRDIIVAMPEDMDFPLTLEKIVRLPGPESYLYQQVAKLHADCHTDADCILHIDSDSILAIPVTPETFLREGKPVWLYRPLHAGSQEEKAWLHVMTKCLGRAPAWEYMCKSTIMVPRAGYGLFRDFVQKRHGMSLDAYVMNQPCNEFSEYNCLGMFLHTFYPGLCHWRNIESEEGPPPRWERQYWSWGGLTENIRREMEVLLQ